MLSFINITSLYIFLTLISFILIINTQYKNYDTINLAKNLLVVIAFLIYTFNLYFNNHLINKFLLPFLLFLNIIILIISELYITKNYLDSLLSCLGLFYILAIFNYKDFELNNGFLIKPNEKWIYLYVLTLIIFYIFSYFIKSKNIAIFGVLYPLLFPLNEYYYHRLFSLFFGYALLNYSN